MFQTTGFERRGFSLLELLVVTAVAAILLSLSVGAFSSALSGMNITRGAQTVVDAINLARETAAARNKVVEVVFSKGSGEGEGFFQVISGRVVGNDGRKSDVIRRQRLPSGVILSTAAGLSSLLDDATPEAVLRIRPNGEVELPPGAAANCFVTVVPARDAEKGGSQLRNFATIQVNPLTARTAVHRP
jgi:uncharacterized protein (TIGR02596 family)